MLKLSDDGMFFVSMPERINTMNEARDIVNVSLTSIRGQMCSRENLINNMISCFRSYLSNIEEAPRINFFIDFEGKTFVVEGNVKMQYPDYMSEIKRYLE